ncbi:MAG: hypothetical protein DHS20C18_42470 [Saprospiraceae bacterium]|nr:MAG: hypothetical protein DHS20C18_42470 [Saprospiraceae bacterium]
MGLRCFKSTLYLYDMSNTSNLYIRLEMIWWLITAIVVIVVLFPIQQTLSNYPFYRANIIFIVGFITFTRYIFLLRYTFLGPLQILKVAIAFLMIPTTFLLVQEINHFQLFLDEEGLDALVGELPFGKRENMVGYIRAEMLFFGTGVCIAAVVIIFRLLISVWLLRNRGRI